MVDFKGFHLISLSFTKTNTPTVPISRRSPHKGSLQLGSMQESSQGLAASALLRRGQPAFHHLQGEDTLNQCLLTSQQVRGLEFR